MTHQATLVRGLSVLCGGLCGLALLLGAGCDKGPKALAEGADAGPTDRQPVLDKDLSAAVAAASAKAGTSAKSDDGPPDNGVFDASEADRRVPRGAAQKVDVIDQGKEPRVTLVSGAAAGLEQKVAVSVGARMGMQAMPGIQYTLKVSIDKPKDAKDGAIPPAGLPVTAKITGVALGKDQPGQIPKEMLDELKKLEDSVVHYTALPNGGAQGFTYELSKKASPELDTPVRTMVEALSALHAPVPPKPVGEGGLWMVTDRASVLGIEVLRYRAYKVVKLDGDTASLSVDVRTYAADKNVSVPAPGGGLASVQVGGFDSQGKGTVTLSPKGFVPAAGDVTLNTRAALLRGQQQMMMQMEMSGSLGAPAK